MSESLTRVRITRNTDTHNKDADIVNGAIRVSTDINNLYIDIDSKRIKITDFIEVDTLTDLEALLAPTSLKFYYVKETNALYKYITNEFKPVGSEIFLTDHPHIDIQPNTETSLSPSFGGSFKVDHPAMDVNGHVVKVNSEKITLPTLPVLSLTQAGIVQKPNGSNKYLRSDGTWVSMSDMAMVGATSTVNGSSGTVPTPTSADYNKFLRGDGTWFTIPEGNVYTAGTGLLLTGEEFSNTGVLSISTGSVNGTISVNTGGTITNVSVKGLGTMAFESSSSYSLSTHTHKYAGSSSAGGAATSAVKLETSRTINGVAFDGTSNITIPPAIGTVGSATQPIYLSNGVLTTCTYTLGKSVPSNAAFTDTWRGIQDNLTSTSATDSLSANQGRVLYNRSRDFGAYLSFNAGDSNSHIFKIINIELVGAYNSFNFEFSLKSRNTAQTNRFEVQVTNSSIAGCASLGSLFMCYKDSDTNAVRAYLITDSDNTQHVEVYATVYGWDTVQIFRDRMYNPNGNIVTFPLAKNAEYPTEYSDYKVSTIHPYVVNHTHSYLPLSGGTMTGTISSSVASTRAKEANTGKVIINSTAAAGFNMLARMKSTNGVFMHGVGGNHEEYSLYYTSDTTISTGGIDDITKKVILLNESGNSIFPGLVTVANGVTVSSGDVNITSGHLVLALGNTSIVWNGGLYRQRIQTHDNDTANDSVFTFQQSSDRGTSFTTLCEVRDNSTVYATNGYYGNNIIFNSTQLSMNRAANTDIGINSITLGYMCTASGDYSIASGYMCTASGDYSTISGGFQNTAEYISTVSGGQYNDASGDYSTISGGQNNIAGGDYSTVSGGYINIASGNYSTVSCGINNIASGDYSTVSGGINNKASGNYSTVSGGAYNEAKYDYQTVIGLYNDNQSDSLFEIGNGTIDSRSNAFRVTNNGNLAATGSVTASGGLFAEASSSTTASPNCYITTSGRHVKTSGSSIRFKTDVKPVEDDELDPTRLYDVDVVQYKLKEEYNNSGDSRYGKNMIGFIAEDIYDKYRIAADYHKEDDLSLVVDDWNLRMVVPALTKLVQDQKKEIDELRATIETILTKLNMKED